MRIRCSPLLALLVLLSTSLHAAELTLKVETSRKEIYLGESLVLSVQVHGRSNVPTPNLSAIKDCRTRLLANEDDSGHWKTVINGKVIRDERRQGRRFVYRVTPNHAGAITLGPITVEDETTTRSHPGTTISVTGVEKQPWVSLDVLASRDAVLVDESFDITVRIRLKRLPTPHHDFIPLVPREPPKLSADFLQLEDTPGLTVPEAKSTLYPFEVRGQTTQGFTIRGHARRSSPFDSPLSMGTPLGDPFAPRPRRFMFKQANITHNGAPYYEYRLTLPYTGRREGAYTFGPVLFKGKVVIGADNQGRGTVQNLFAVGAAQTVRVVPPPETKRPASYIGAIGTNLVATAELDTQTCFVGDPLKLTLTLSGDISLDNIYPPVLSDQPQLASTFRIYDGTVETRRYGGRKEYIYTVRPTQAGTLELPPIDISYFDLTERSYRTVQTKAIPLRANEATQVGTNTILTVVTDMNDSANGPDPDGFMPAPIMASPRGSVSASLSPQTWLLAVIIVAPVAFMTVVGTRSTLQFLRRRRPEAIRMAAVRHARTQLHRAGHLAGEDPVAARAALATALRNYLGQRFATQGTALTPSDAAALLSAARIDPTTRTAFCALLERNFNAAYATAPTPNATAKEDIQEAIELLGHIDTATKRGGA